MIRPGVELSEIYICTEAVDFRNYAEYSVMCCCEAEHAPNADIHGTRNCA